MREKKQDIIKELIEKISKQKIILFVDFSFLKAREISTLRQKLKENSNELKVAKKTLIEIAFKQKNISLGLNDMKNQIGLIFGFKDEISPIKIAYDFLNKNQNLKILGCLLENRFFKENEIRELAKISSIDELKLRFLNTISCPFFIFINTLKFTLKGLILILSNIKR